MMGNYYKREDLDSALSEFLVSPYANEDTQFSCGVKDALKLLRDIVNENVPDCLKLPAADVVEVVRCKDCKHRILNKRYGERGYMNIKAACDLDTGDPYQLGRFADVDDWFCADGERKGKTDDFE